MFDKFNSSNADIKFRSSDGVEFHLHRALLQANTGAFPGPEIDAQGKSIRLTEPANVLRILFDFVYPKRHSDLEEINFELVAAVAEAVEKYEVFPAMPPCNARLREFLPQHATEIFVHATKHDYPKMINETIPLVARAPFVSVMEKLPPSYMIPWSQYHQTWVQVFQQASHYATQITTCSSRQNSMLKWLLDLEKLDTVSALNEALQEASNQSGRKYKHTKLLAKFCQEKIQAIPAFSSFVTSQK